MRPAACSRFNHPYPTFVFPADAGIHSVNGWWMRM